METAFPARRRTRHISPEIAEVITECLADGLPRSKVFEHRPDARLYLKRVRYGAEQYDARVQARTIPDTQTPGHWRLTITVTERTPE